MFVDVAVTASVKVTLQPMNHGAIFANEIHEVNRPFAATISDNFLIRDLDAGSRADAEAKIKLGSQKLAYSFMQARGTQYQNQNTSIQSAAMDTAASWACTLLYSPSPQRTDPNIIQVQI